jgi:diguanylate cyclase (GGDEF)-like protein
VEHEGEGREPLPELAAAIRESAWELALECVEEGLAGDAVPSLARVGRLGQLGDIPTFVAELAAEVASPSPARLRRGSPLAAIVRDHAREREALGFAPREILTEFLILRRVLWRFVSKRAGGLAAAELMEAQRRLDDTLDRLLTECVVAYFDRATSELAYRARTDPLTELLNHQAFTRELAQELERSRRYGHALALVFLDVDSFKAINDTLGHPEGDRILRCVATLLREGLRTSDLAGRLGGDEFAVALIEADEEAAGRFLSRLGDAIAERVRDGRLPDGFSLTPGVALYPVEGGDADALLRVADARLYERRRETE